MTSIAKFYQQVRRERAQAREQAAEPVPTTTAKSPSTKTKSRGVVATVYLSWIDVVEYDPEPKRARYLNLTEDQLASLQQELSVVMGERASLVSMMDFGHRTLRLNLSAPDEASLRRAVDKVTEDETEVDQDVAILLIEQRGTDIPVGEGPSLSVDALWSVQVILEPEDADEISHPRDEEYPITDLKDDEGLKSAYLALYGRSEVTAEDGIRVVDAQILPDNQLKLVFLGKPGVDVPRMVRRLAGTGGEMGVLGLENLLLHTPHVHLHVDEDGEEEVEVAFDEEEQTQGSFDVSLPKGSVYRVPSKKPASRKA